MAVNEAQQLAEWYRAYSAELVLYARQLTNDLQAEDIVQDAFIKLLKERSRPDNVRAWLYRVVRNASVSTVRRLRRRRLLRHTDSSRRPSWFESRSDDLMDARRAQALLAGLPVPWREIVVLRIWGQMSLCEVAQEVDKPVSTVHHVYQTALQTMREKLEHASCTTKKD